VPYEELKAALDCDPKLIAIVQSKYPNNIALAEHAVAAHPESAEAWFWLGDLLPEYTIEYYRYGLALKPSDGLRWLKLGGLLQTNDPQAAIQAYLQACKNGDPGYSGCLHAGDLAEKIGDYEAAIEYYRLSHYDRIRNNADKLELQLIDSDSP
jgi:tetratricopeptide (TPR) repeat protein